MLKVVEKLLRGFKTKYVELEHNGKKYRMPVQRGETLKEAGRRFREYALKAPVCVGCDQIIFPGTPVTKVTPGRVIGGHPTLKQEIPIGLAHNAFPCIPCSNFIGWIGDNGELIPAFEGGLSAREVAMQKGELPIIPNWDDLRPKAGRAS